MNSTQPAYRHREAFCLMRYRDSYGRTETVWNSRDGVTPFMVINPDGIVAQHVDWDKDLRAVDHKPKAGDRIFVDNTDPAVHNIMLDRAKKFVEQAWNHETAPMRMHEAFKDMTEEQAVQHWLKIWTDEKGAPALVTVVDWGSRTFE